MYELFTSLQYLALIPLRLFALANTDSNPNPDVDICPKNGYSSNWGSESG